MNNPTDEVKNKVMARKTDTIGIVLNNSDFKSGQVHSTIYEYLAKGSMVPLMSILHGPMRVGGVEKKYIWISFPESDEFLEGPDRTKTYYEHLQTVPSNIKLIEFKNYIYWFTEHDDPDVVSPIERVRHYCLKSKCCPRLYAWRSGFTNTKRWFGHIHPTDDKSAIAVWKTRHYEGRSKEQFIHKFTNRKYISDNITNHHYMMVYKKICADASVGDIDPAKLHYDNGQELNPTEIYNWKDLY